MVETEILRNSHLIDPQMHIWGWEIAAYLFLGGITAGLMTLSAIGMWRFGSGRSRALRWAPLLAIALLSLGMGALFLDLESKLHVFRFYLTFHLTSPMSWGSWILLAIYPATILFGIAQLTDREWSASVSRLPLRVRLDQVRNWSRRRERSLAIWNIALGILLGTYTGVLLGTLGARALWSSPLLGPLFLASGFSSAAALLLLTPLAHQEHAWAMRWDIAAIGVEAALLLLYFAGLFAGGTSTRAAAGLLFGGAYTAVFWSLVVIAGLAIPLTMEALEGKMRLAPTVAAPALVLIGGLSLRWILVAAGQAL
ncbi:MAG TPA: NrfD/PsrC family molybdoenzyme membrane anchor subunit [Thermoanaerobaculia bacterium]